ncbi:hypothetical protein CWO89_40260 [Bradyrhizobium sp. Leo170]|nr:hypothetical protein CWO89_40260 [Bradyrhizobium sp. Leo170]
MCQQQCDQRIGYGGEVTTGQHVPDRGRVAPISHCRISIRLMSLVGQERRLSLAHVTSRLPAVEEIRTNSSDFGSGPIKDISPMGILSDPL